MTARNPPDAGLIGTRIGNYEITALLGKGGMGEVYLGRHPFLGKEVAVKILSARLTADAQQVARFQQEARAACRIGHPAIVDVQDFGNLPDGRCYCVMERLHGLSLGEHLATHGRLDLQQAVRFLTPVLQALAKAHEAGIVHRDIKPDNIFLARGHDDKVHPKVLDFGIAKLLTTASDEPLASTQTGSLLGTPLYMSPEQAAGATKRIGPGSDVYSVGALLFHMLSGRPPYLGDSFGDVLIQHMQSQPPSIRNLRPDIPERVDAVIRTALAKTPEERFHNMNAFAAALTAAAADTVPSDPPRHGHTTARQADAATGAPVPASAPVASAVGVATGPTDVEPASLPAAPVSVDPLGQTSLSDAAAQQVQAVSQPPVAPQPATTSAPTPSSKKKIILAGTGGVLLGMVAVGVIIFATRSPKKKKTAAKESAATEASKATPAPDGSPPDQPLAAAMAAAPATDPTSSYAPARRSGMAPIALHTPGRNSPGETASPARPTRSSRGAPVVDPVSRGAPPPRPPVYKVPLPPGKHSKKFKTLWKRHTQWDPNTAWTPPPDPITGKRRNNPQMARIFLKNARNFFKSNNCGFAMNWGLRSYQNKPSTTAAYIVGVCACRIKRKSQAKQAYRRAGSKRKAIQAECRKKGIKIP